MTNTQPERTVLNPKSKRETAQRIGNAVGRVWGHARAIHALLFASRPPAVAWGVVFHAVDTIKGMAFGPNAHVIKECLEGRVPTIANANAFSSVARKACSPRIVTALLHLSPRGVSRSVIFPVGGVAMFEKSIPRYFRMKASTAFARARAKVSDLEMLCLATITAANPVAALLRSLQDRPPFKPLPRVVDSFHSLKPYRYVGTESS